MERTTHICSILYIMLTLLPCTQILLLMEKHSSCSNRIKFDVSDQISGIMCLSKKCLHKIVINRTSYHHIFIQGVTVEKSIYLTVTNVSFILKRLENLLQHVEGITCKLLTCMVIVNLFVIVVLWKMTFYYDSIKICLRCKQKWPFLPMTEQLQQHTSIVFMTGGVRIMEASLADIDAWKSGKCLC